MGLVAGSLSPTAVDEGRNGFFPTSGTLVAALASLGLLRPRGLLASLRRSLAAALISDAADLAREFEALARSAESLAALVALTSAMPFLISFISSEEKI